MSTRWLTHCLCAALLVFGMVALSTGKPPDLPAQDKVNCKDNPAVPEYGSSPVPTGAVELEEVVPEPEVEAEPIDTLYPWLDALIRACEERAEVWFEDSTDSVVRATASHTVEVVDASEACEEVQTDPVCKSVRACCACINKAVAACAKSAKGEEKLKWRPVRQAACNNCLSGNASCPMCKSVRACCACVNHIVARFATQGYAITKADCSKCKVCESRGVIIYSVSPKGVVFFKFKGVADKGQTASANCPLCRSFRACCGQVKCAMAICIRGCEMSNPSEQAEPKDESCPECTSPCPWMREKDAKPEKPSAGAAAIPCTPLDNLQKLEQARKLMKAAEQFQKVGKMEKARMTYAKICALVPGSRLDAAAEQQIRALDLAHMQDLKQREKVAVQEEQEPKSTTPAPASTCPFMLMKQTKKTAQAAPACFPNALDNLKSLEQAQKMLENAEQCVKEGMLDQAAALFRQIHLVCPGSPVDRTASQEGEALNAKLGEARMILGDALRLVLTQNYDQACDLYSKLEDLLPNSLYAQIAAEHRSMIQYIGAAFRPAPAEEAEAKPCCVEERVAELLEECQRAIADGEYGKAAKLAKKAQKLDHDCVAANALVFKTHLLIQLQEKQKQIERAKRSQNDACVPLCPRMPEIDPAVVRDIERALQIREETIARERKQREAGQTEEAEPKAPPQDDEDSDGPQARRQAAEDCLARLTGIVHAGTGLEISITRKEARFAVHCPPSLAPLMAAADGIGKAIPSNLRNIAGYGNDAHSLLMMVQPRMIICEEEEERAVPRGDVAP
jgi:hypothetical protein